MAEEIKEVEDPADLPLNLIHGFPYPHFVPVEKFDEFKDQAKFLDGDLLIISYPKTGNHWADGYLGMLLKPSRQIIKAGTGLLEGTLTQEKIDSQQHPRIFYTHLHYQHLPRDVLENDKIKILLLIRNPKDTVVSYYHFMKKWESHSTKYTGPFSTFVGPWIDGRLSYGSWFDFYRDYYKNFVERENVFVVQFEKLKSDFVSNLKKIAEFLKVDANEDFLRLIEEQTSLPRMSGWAATQPLTDDRLPMTDFFRKGVVGDWRSQMEPDAAKRIDEKLEELNPMLVGYEDFEG